MTVSPIYKIYKHKKLAEKLRINIEKFHLQTNECQAHWEIKDLFLLKTSLYSFHCCSCISSSHLDWRTPRTDLAPRAFLLSTFSCIFLRLLYMACLIDLTSTGKRSVVSCFAISVWILYRKPSYRFPSVGENFFHVFKSKCYFGMNNAYQIILTSSI